MATDLIIVGPIEIPFQNAEVGSSKHIGKAHARDFWENHDAQLVAKKQGCYVFAMCASRGFKPWYVGKATRSMEQECFADHKLSHYNEILFGGPKGTPVMFFAVPRGAKNKIAASVIDDMETFLIQTAVYKNSDLRNVQKTRVPEWTIQGVIRSPQGQPPRRAVRFRTMMGLD